MEIEANWSMGSDIYKIVAIELTLCLEAQKLSYAKPNAENHWEWYSAITGLASVCSVLMKEKDFNEIAQCFEKFEEKYNLKSTGTLAYESEDSPALQYQINRDLLEIQVILLRKSHENKLLIPTTPNMSKIPVGARNYDN
jgi:ABC-type Zn2+ transport system substrate-binding protein/surface adhesin